MQVCPICDKQCKSLSRHTWKSHGPGVSHKPFKGKTLVPWNKNLSAKDNSSLANASAIRKGKIQNRSDYSVDSSTRLKISVSMRGNNNGKHRGDRQSFHNGIRMDSSWEVKVASYFDSKAIKWQYGQKVFPLTDNTSYRPDFELEDGTIIEVKGYWRKENKAKFNLWISLYPNVKYEVWDKTKLKELKLI